MALSIAMSSVWDGAVEVVKGMVDPAAFQAMVYTSLATCMGLLLVPEPITKALMVAITVGLCTYLGWSTVWGILRGWERLRAEAAEARTFDELSAAGERFGKLLGANTARVMVMVTTMALGSAAGAAMRGAGPGLPGWGSARRRRRSQLMGRRSLIALCRSRPHRQGGWEQIRKQGNMSYSTHIARGLGMGMCARGMN